MHGEANGSGAPSGERNGNYRQFCTSEAIAERKSHSSLSAIDPGLLKSKAPHWLNGAGGESERSRPLLFGGNFPLFCALMSVNGAMQGPTQLAHHAIPKVALMGNPGVRAKIDLTKRSRLNDS